MTVYKYHDAIQEYARRRGISLQDAAQTFLQVITLRHASVPEARFMGGTALVLGYANPRFSEDIDLTQVKDPKILKGGLQRARSEIEGWFSAPVILSAPKENRRTWRLTVQLGRSESLALHVDSQPYKAYTSRPVVIEYPSISPFVCQALELDEIMAEKIIAVGCRNYLGGRDLFDLWFHWLRGADWKGRTSFIAGLVQKKLRERAIGKKDFGDRLTGRLAGRVSLLRAQEEWRRYLPREFQQASVLNDVIKRCQLLAGGLDL